MKAWRPYCPLTIGFRLLPVDHTDADELAAIEQSRPDVVLIDLNLPDQLALELTRHVHERVDSAKVILLTHANSREDLVECFEAGARVACWRNPRSTIFGGAIVAVAAGKTFCSPQMVH